MKRTLHAHVSTLTTLGVIATFAVVGFGVLASAGPEDRVTRALPTAVPTRSLPAPQDTSQEAVQRRLAGLGGTNHIVAAATRGDLSHIMHHIDWTTEACLEAGGDKDEGPLCAGVGRRSGDQVETVPVGYIAPVAAPREYVQAFLEAALSTGLAQLTFAAPLGGSRFAVVVTFPAVARPIGDGPLLGSIWFELEPNAPRPIKHLSFLDPSANLARAYQEVYQGTDMDVWYYPQGQFPGRP